MSVWWSYRPGDLLMFAPGTYWRLFELQNDFWWPLPLFVPAVGLALTVWLWRRPAALTFRMALAFAAVVWAFVGWAFVWQRYLPINSAASVFAAGFLLQAGALGALAAASRWPPGRPVTPPVWRRRGGVALLGWALAGQPLLAAASGRPWLQAEVFALAPDPTAMATLGLLLLLPPANRMTAGLFTIAWLLAVLWCVISAATLWTMGSMQGWVPAGAAFFALLVRWLGRAHERGRIA